MSKSVNRPVSEWTRSPPPPLLCTNQQPAPVLASRVSSSAACFCVSFFVVHVDCLHTFITPNIISSPRQPGRGCTAPPAPREGAMRTASSGEKAARLFFLFIQPVLLSFFFSYFISSCCSSMWNLCTLYTNQQV